MHPAVAQALEQWQNEGFLTPRKAKQLRSVLEPQDSQLPVIASRSLLMIGGGLIFLGFMLFVTHSWSQLSVLVQTVSLSGGIIASALGAQIFARKHGYEYIYGVLALFHIGLFVMGMYLLAQSYGVAHRFWLSSTLATLFSGYFAYIFKARFYLWLAILCGVFATGWIRVAFGLGFPTEPDILFNTSASLIGLLPILGVLCICLANVHGRFAATEFGVKTWFSWGLFLVLFAAITLAVNESVFFRYAPLQAEPITITILLLLLILFCLAQWYGVFVTKSGRFGLAILLLYTVVFYCLVHVPLLLEPDGWRLEVFSFIYNLAYLMHVGLVIALLLTVLWYGILLRRSAIINMGIFGLGIHIVIQYFSFVFSIQDRALFFIGGGLVTMTVSIGLERQRRRLLQKIQS